MSDTTAPTTDDADGWEWAVVEVFGHRRHAGRIREEERFGTKLLRIDIPIDGDPDAKGWRTHYYGGASIFSLTPCERDAALKVNKPYEPPARLRLAHSVDEDASHDDMPF
ncbi:hypothetical protein [Methylobacterium nodulans]|uniref:Uncharacterized protein n=1 Tax=Methylobacterium nodulans (strain LMG 21967 / CNCM I-2342 / ORS 2060) TaxID=460265 RepID=B8IIS5_METNO|nr:hypothetical protein [Methylobacterium nodulans]ACL59952.1 hypothetical protein Mnod_5106 [Methylobacterium nodulans ORS 2060]